MSLIKIFTLINRAPINVYNEEVFFDRIDLFESTLGLRTKWENFLIEVKDKDVKYELENFISKVPQYLKDELSKTDISSGNYTVPSILNARTGFSYSELDPSKVYAKIDMQSANFNSLKILFGLFDNYDNWESYTSNFTSIASIAKSKHLRNIVFGKSNAKGIRKIIRYVTYETFQQLIYTLGECIYTSEDEIMFEIKSNDDLSFINSIVSGSDIPFKCTTFKINKFDSGLLYLSDYYTGEFIRFVEQDPESLPKRVRKDILGEQLSYYDDIIFHNGKLYKEIII